MRKNAAYETMAAAAADPGAYIATWRERHPGQKVAAVLPMNFPAELLAAAGVLPVIVQESRGDDSEGRSLLAEFYCGYTRDLASQAATGAFDVYDGVFVADHCVQLLGAADIIRVLGPGRPIHFGQFIASMNESATEGAIREVMTRLVAEIESFAGRDITEEAFEASVRAHNHGRQLLREVFERRRAGLTDISAPEVQVLIVSAMVMDREEHNALLEEVVRDLPGAAEGGRRVRLHLSGHLCHAPRPELLAVIEEVGAEVADDDLYTGGRYISTDVPVGVDPVTALSQWYFDRNVNVPCPTRVQHDVDWDQYLLDAVTNGRADGVVVLLPKFCEPHMLMYPELRKALEEHQVPHVLLETEHQGLPLEASRTRLEALVEGIHRRSAVGA